MTLAGALHGAGIQSRQHATAELAELFSVGRSTVYRAVQRAGELGAARTRS